MSSMKTKQEDMIHVSKDGWKLTLNLSHLSKHDLNPYGHISPWRLANLFETARGMSFYTTDFFLAGISSKGYRVFSVAIEYNIKHTLYQLDNMFTPIRLDHVLLSYKKTSSIFQTTMYNTNTGKELASLKLKYVLVDAETRRPAPLPSEYVERLKGFAQDTTSPDLTYTVIKPPSNAFVSHFTIQASDTDLNNHANNSTYIRLCFDTLASASMKNSKQSLLLDNLANYRIMNMKMYYEKESKEGDKLDVYAWPSNEKGTIHFVIKKANIDIYHSSMKLVHQVKLKSQL